MTELPNVPDGYVALRPALPREEALILQGLLESSDIPAPLITPSAGLHTYTRAPSSTVAVYVPADRAEEAEALLAAELASEDEGP